MTHPGPTYTRPGRANKYDPIYAATASSMICRTWFRGELSQCKADAHPDVAVIRQFYVAFVEVTWPLRKPPLPRCALARTRPESDRRDHRGWDRSPETSEQAA